MQPLSFVDLGRNAHGISNENEIKRSVWDFSFLVQWAKKALGMLFYATYLVSLIPSVRATDKCRFDTRIWVFLDLRPWSCYYCKYYLRFEIFEE